jgi:two-component system sensor histidine kinase FlrB
VLAETLLADLRAAVTPQLVDSGVRLILSDRSGGAGLQGHREALLSVLLNLVDNALLACGDGGTVKVTTALDDHDRLEIGVADDGPGIDSAVQARMFEPFFTTRPQGTGLGLAVVRAVVDGYGGEIEVDSSAEAGTRITLKLPRTAHARNALPSGRAHTHSKRTTDTHLC